MLMRHCQDENATGVVTIDDLVRKPSYENFSHLRSQRRAQVWVLPNYVYRTLGRRRE